MALPTTPKPRACGHEHEARAGRGQRGRSGVARGQERRRRWPLDADAPGEVKLVYGEAIAALPAKRAQIEELLAPLIARAGAPTSSLPDLQTGPSGEEATAHALPSNLPLQTAFLAVFESLCERDYPALLQPGGYSDCEDLAADYDNAIGCTLDMLDIAEPEGDSLDWKGVLHDWIEERYPHLGEAFEVDDAIEDRAEPMRPSMG